MMYDETPMPLPTVPTPEMIAKPYTPPAPPTYDDARRRIDYIADMIDDGYDVAGMARCAYENADAEADTLWGDCDPADRYDADVARMVAREMWAAAEAVRVIRDAPRVFECYETVVTMYHNVMMECAWFGPGMVHGYDRDPMALGDWLEAQHGEGEDVRGA